MGGKNVEGTFLPAGPVLVARQLPATNPVRASALAYVTTYEAKYGKDSVSTFGGHAWDAGQLMAAAIPVALKKAQPGTPEFRAALRDALENTKNVAGAHGIFNMSPPTTRPRPARPRDGQDRRRHVEGPGVNMNPVQLQSYIAGRFTGARAGAALASAVDGHTVAFAHADELDFGEPSTTRAAWACPRCSRWTSSSAPRG